MRVFNALIIRENYTIDSKKVQSEVLSEIVASKSIVSFKLSLKFLKFLIIFPSFIIFLFLFL